jgi:hypothetical protein
MMREFKINQDVMKQIAKTSSVEELRRLAKIINKERKDLG